MLGVILNLQRQFGHRIVNELLPQCGEFILFCIVERRLHQPAGWRPLGLAGMGLSNVVASIVNLPMLSRDSACGKVADEQFEQVRFSRIFFYRAFAQRLPNFSAGTTGPTIYFAYDHEMELRIIT